MESFSHGTVHDGAPHFVCFGGKTVTFLLSNLARRNRLVVTRGSESQNVHPIRNYLLREFLTTVTSPKRKSALARADRRALDEIRARVRSRTGDLSRQDVMNAVWTDLSLPYIFKQAVERGEFVYAYTRHTRGAIIDHAVVDPREEWGLMTPALILTRLIDDRVISLCHEGG